MTFSPSRAACHFKVLSDFRRESANGVHVVPEKDENFGKHSFQRHGSTTLKCLSSLGKVGGIQHLPKAILGTSSLFLLIKSHCLRKKIKHTNHSQREMMSATMQIYVMKKFLYFETSQSLKQGDLEFQTRVSR